MKLEMAMTPSKKASKAQLLVRFYDYFTLIIRFLLNVLLVVICAVLVIAIFKTAHDTVKAIHEPLDIILQSLLLDVVLIVAVIEIANIVLGYLKDGRVHVRYIIDTVLVIMANEFVAVWFHNPSLIKVASLCLSVATLTGIRVIIARYLPED